MTSIKPGGGAPAELRCEGSQYTQIAKNLRTDVHRLYDRAYLSVDADLRLEGLPQLRSHGWNGREFYQREAEKYTPSADRPPTSARPRRAGLALRDQVPGCLIGSATDAVTRAASRWKDCHYTSQSQARGGSTKRGAAVAFGLRAGPVAHR